MSTIRRRTVFLPLALLALPLLSCSDGLTDTAIPVDAGAPAVAATAGPSQLLAPDGSVRITEIHYDNDGTDTGEAVEITGPAGTSLDGWTLVLYNGSSSQLKPYDDVPLSGTLADACNGEGSTVLTFPSNGIQNGGPDGLALVDGAGTVVEFISYEGTLTPVEGPATGMTSTDIGVRETSSTPVGHSLQRTNAGWQEPAPSTFGACGGEDDGGEDGGEDDGEDEGELGPNESGVYISEIHYDNDGGDENEAIEVRADAGTDLAGWSVVLYNGSDRETYGSTIDLEGVIPETCGEQGGLRFAHAGLQNGNDALALVDPSGTVVEFLSYEGAFTAVGGPADGLTATDLGVRESSSTLSTESLQRDAVDQPWYGPAAATFGCEADDDNGGEDGGSGGNGGSPSGPVFLSEIRADQPDGNSDEYFELGGAPGTTLGGVALVVLGDGDGGAGVVEEVTEVGEYALSAQGALVVAEEGFGLGTADLTTSLNFENGDNPTFLLVTGFTGSNGQDLDTDDDGSLDATPWTEVLDCVSLIEYLGLQPIYCDARLGGGESYTPGHVVRMDDGWISGSFWTDNDNPGELDFAPAAAVAGTIAPWGVGAPGEPSDITVSESYVRLPVGYNRALYVNVVDDFRDEVEGAWIEFTSSNPGIATSDRYGNVMATGVGTATLMLSVAGTDASASVTVEVVPDAPSGVAYQDHVEFGTPTDANPGDDIVLGKDEYVTSYNADLGAPNWVSWNLDASHIGEIDRCECYTPDPALPASAPQVLNFDYTGSGYSRGHVLQSFTRTRTLPDNAATYLTTNIIPQASANNGGPWGAFESYTNNRASAGNEVYIIAGGIWGPNPPTLKDEGKVSVPNWTWKVAVFVDRDETLADVRSLDDLEVVAIITPNRLESGVPGSVDGISGDWQDYVVEVGQIEAATGYDLLALLPDAFEEQLETGFDDLAAEFQELVADGALHRGAERALGAQLNNAARHLARGRTAQPAQSVETFLHLLDRFERGGKVGAADAERLRAMAGEVLAVLGLS